MRWEHFWWVGGCERGGVGDVWWWHVEGGVGCVREGMWCGRHNCSHVGSFFNFSNFLISVNWRVPLSNYPYIGLSFPYKFACLGKSSPLCPI